jgi:hypothetical protein
MMMMMQDNMDLASVRRRVPEYEHTWGDKELNAKFHS